MYIIYTLLLLIITLEKMQKNEKVERYTDPIFVGPNLKQTPTPVTLENGRQAYDCKFKGMNVTVRYTTRENTHNLTVTGSITIQMPFDSEWRTFWSPILRKDFIDIWDHLSDSVRRAETSANQAASKEACDLLENYIPES